MFFRFLTYLSLFAFFAPKSAFANMGMSGATLMLHSALKEKSVSRLKDALSVGGDANSKINGTPLLHLAIRSDIEDGDDNFTITRALLKSANPDVQDAHSDTAMHLTVTLLKDLRVEPSLVQSLGDLLVSRGANPTLRNRADQTPVEMLEHFIQHESSNPQRLVAAAALKNRFELSSSGKVTYKFAFEAQRERQAITELTQENETLKRQLSELQARLASSGKGRKETDAAGLPREDLKRFRNNPSADEPALPQNTPTRPLASPLL